MDKKAQGLVPRPTNITNEVDGLKQLVASLQEQLRAYQAEATVVQPTVPPNTVLLPYSMLARLAILRQAGSNAIDFTKPTNRKRIVRLLGYVTEPVKLEDFRERALCVPRAEINAVLPVLSTLVDGTYLGSNKEDVAKIFTFQRALHGAEVVAPIKAKKVREVVVELRALIQAETMAISDQVLADLEEIEALRAANNDETLGLISQREALETEAEALRTALAREVEEARRLLAEEIERARAASNQEAEQATARLEAELAGVRKQLTADQERVARWLETAAADQATADRLKEEAARLSAEANSLKTHYSMATMKANAEAARCTAMIEALGERERAIDAQKAVMAAEELRLKGLSEDLEAQMRSLKDQETVWADIEGELSGREEQLRLACLELKARQEALEEGQAQLELDRQQSNATLQNNQAAVQALEKGQHQLQQGRAQLDTALESYAAKVQALEEGQAKLAADQEKLQKDSAELQGALSLYEIANKDLEEGRRQLAAQVGQHGQERAALEAARLTQEAAVLKLEEDRRQLSAEHGRLIANQQAHVSAVHAFEREVAGERKRNTVERQTPTIGQETLLAAQRKLAADQAKLGGDQQALAQGQRQLAEGQAQLKLERDRARLTALEVKAPAPEAPPAPGTRRITLTVVENVPKQVPTAMSEEAYVEIPRKVCKAVLIRLQSIIEEVEGQPDLTELLSSLRPFLERSAHISATYEEDTVIDFDTSGIGVAQSILTALRTTNVDNTLIEPLEKLARFFPIVQ